MTHLERIRLAVGQAKIPGKNVIDQGPFRILIDKSRTVVYVNYAVPVSTVHSPVEQLDRLIATFNEHNRKPRLEFAIELNPGLEDALEDAGFRREQALPMMACRREYFKPRTADSYDIRMLGPDDDVRIYYWTANQAFGMQLPISEKPIPKAMADAETGTLHIAIASTDAHPVACAVIGPTWELSGVGVLPDHRRQGLASAVSSLLLEDHFKSHDMAWLSADDEIAESVYRGLGFEHVGTNVAWVLDQPQSTIAVDPPTSN